jgi:chemotaxis protein MotB
MSTGKGHSKRKPRGGHEEEHEGGHERWLVTYADLLTLLMVLFIVMFAISSVDQKKFAALKNGLAAGFGAQTVFDGGPGTLQGDGQDNSAINVNPDVPSAPRNPAEAKAVKEAVASADRAKAQAQLRAAEQEVASFEKLKKQIKKALAQSKQSAGVEFRIDERGLVVTIVTSSVVFAGDRAELLPAGQRILDAVGPPLTAVPNKLEVDGHTNQLPVPTRNYPTAWELSTARACTVVRYLITRSGVPADRLTAAGFAGERPLYPVSDPRAVTLNRRVEIVVLSGLPAAERALLPTAVGAN